ncbi:DNA polymerase/3'-5' exonuclease PolX [bacterium]|nr:DNA polymerase/3'-5' exonuclease PolX [bacterium]
MDNSGIAGALEEYATLLELKGENQFRARAYSSAARTIRSLEEECSSLLAEGRFTKIRGIGESIESKIKELCDTGKLKALEDLRAAIPRGLLELIRIQGLGPKKAKVLWEELKVQSIEDLKKACQEGKVAVLKGFGEKTQAHFLEGIERLSTTHGRVLLAYARATADAFVARLRKIKAAKRVEIAGSTRRGKESVQDVDVLVAADHAEPIMEAVRKAAPEVIATGPTKTSIRTEDGLQIDVRVVKPKEFGAAWTYFTGSKEFNIAIRQLALEKGYSLNEYTLSPIAGGDAIPCPTEEDVFRALDLRWVPPEMRENAGEIRLAQEDKLPRLVEREDLRGVLHVHTTESDGKDTLEKMVQSAIDSGFEFVGISDHSKAAFYAHGLDEERIARQAEAIERLRSKVGKKIRIFHGVEADILPGGGVDLEQKTLESLDFVIASIHSQFTMEKDKMTKRVLSALEHPCVTVFGHPTARQILGREGAAFDWEKVFESAKKNDVAIEINGQPARLDADWVHVRRARSLGLKLMANPDAHGVDELPDYTENAIREARRGWATKDDLVNTRPAARFAKEILGLTS